jgi:hypothetical protein
MQGDLMYPSESSVLIKFCFSITQVGQRAWPDHVQDRVSLLIRWSRLVKPVPCPKVCEARPAIISIPSQWQTLQVW